MSRGLHFMRRVSRLRPWTSSPCPRLRPSIRPDFPPNRANLLTAGYFPSHWPDTDKIKNSLTGDLMRAATDETGESGRVRLPGFGLCMSYMPEIRFPTALIDWQDQFQTIRERCMLAFINSITDKPDWHEKVFDDAIVAKWRQEASTAKWEALGIENGDFTDSMFDYCLDELRDKAKFFADTGITVVLENRACVAKSDEIVSPALRDRLREAVSMLEDIPDSEKDWHPGSDGKVLDLVHPSLWPLLYGRSRVLPDRTIDLKNCLDSCGEGEVTAVPSEEDALQPDPEDYTWRSGHDAEVWSRRFQWLPCNVEFRDGANAQIVSYINNLHPTQHSSLYTVIEEMISKAVPLWHIIWKWTNGPCEVKRIHCDEVKRNCTVPEICTEYCDPYNRPKQDAENFTDEDLDDDYGWYYKTHPIARPEPGAYGAQPLAFTPEDIKREGGLLYEAKDKLQVIVKLANIHLTPDKPTYDGGSWHIEGQLNEHICATALYYYDNENITDSHLAFRTRVEADNTFDLTYEQSDYEGIEEIFGAKNDEATIQERGKVLTKEGRLLAFPNVFQHAVMPFELVDKTKPGHRKILALFLVDPAARVLSTANVPPQQKHWWTERSNKEGKAPDGHNGLQDAVLNETGGLPISLEEAKKLREELMAERTNLSTRVDSRIARESWNFCEH